ncbi:MAG: hypothetical protein ACTS73_05575 [Arsenophonus sp. NEOnobi-MAG3]
MSDFIIERLYAIKKFIPYKCIRETKYTYDLLHELIRNDAMEQLIPTASLRMTLEAMLRQYAERRLISQTCHMPVVSNGYLPL